MSILTEEIQKEYIANNFNKIVIYCSKIGRLIGYAKTKRCLLNIIAFGNGHTDRVVYIDAGLKLTFLEKDNILFEETNELLKLNGNPEIEQPLYLDLQDDIMFNSYGVEYVKENAFLFFNKIVNIDQDIIRLIGYAKDDYGNSYIGLNINNEKKYFDSMFRIKEVALSVELKSHFEENIERIESIVIEDLREIDDL